MKKQLRYLFALLFVSTTFTGFSQSTSHSFTYGGVTRTYRVYLPTNFSSSVSLPLVFNLHGVGSNGQQEELYTLFDNVADTGRCVVVYPDGVSNQWNMVVGCTGSTSPCTGVDDVGFISALIDTMHANYNIDLGRVYACGMSMGGFMTFRLACELSCRIAAAASVTGLLQEATPLYPACSPTRKMPVVQIHGTADSTVKYTNSYPYASVSNTVSRWKSIDGCPSTATVINIPNTNTSDGCTATENYYGLCGDSTLFIQYTINGGEHTWPDANPLSNLGITNRDMNASSVIWNFFKHYNTPANLTFTGLASTYCSSASSVTLTGSPSGGTFSGAGVSGTTFNPATAGTGTHTITYTISWRGCTYTKTKTVTVTGSSAASITGLSAHYCKNAGTVALSGSPSGGTFSGTGVSGTNFNPQTAGVGGPYTITYSGTSGGCAFSTTQNVTVDSVPNANFSGLSSSYCLSQNPGTITLTGTPSGGTFSGTGVSGNTFTPSTAGGGTHAITYTVTLGNCSATSTQNTTVVASTTASISGLNGRYCADASAVTLTGNPSGGTFSGTGVSGSTFNPQTAGVGGPYQVSYQGTLSGCSFTGSQSVYVDTLPVVHFTGLDTFYCLNASPNTINLSGSPSGGTFSGQGISGNQFHISTAGAGTHTITYSYTDGHSCTGTRQSTVRVASCTDIQDASLFEELSVYPNPANDILNIQYRSRDNQNLKLALIDILGREVLSMPLGNDAERKLSLNTKDISAGVFFLKIESNSNRVVRKVVIQHQ